MMTHVTFLIHKRSKRNVDLMHNSEDGEVSHVPGIGEELRHEIGGKEKIWRDWKWSKTRKHSTREW